MWAGYNTLEDVKEPILEHIRKQNAIYLTQEHEMQRSNHSTKLEDSRVDIALFFIAPHRLRPIDIEFITDLAEIVPVVSHPLTRTPQLSHTSRVQLSDSNHPPKPEDSNVEIALFFIVAHCLRTINIEFFIDLADIVPEGEQCP